jgi:lipoprotein-releasing system permease protein
VMNGFDFQMRSRILGAVSQAQIISVDGGVKDVPRALKIAEANPHVLGVAPYVENEAYLTSGRGSSGVLVRGIDPARESKVVDIGSHMLEGKLDALTPNSWNIVLGRELAMTLGVGVGDRITMAVGELRATPMGGIPRMRSFHVVGTFQLGMEQFDSHLALVNMSDAEKLNDLDGPTGIRLKLDDLFNARPVAHALSDQLGQFYAVRTWMDTNANLFHALSMEKMVMFIILSLIVLVAVINLISMLMMLVTDKQADIAILRTLGATPRSIMGVFMVQGLLVGFVGIGLGVSLGSLLSWRLPGIVKWIEHTFHVTFLSPDVYYISEVPSRLQLNDVVWVALLTFAFSLLATLYPAWRASRTQPAQALRYE